MPLPLRTGLNPHGSLGTCACQGVLFVHLADLLHKLVEAEQFLLGGRSAILAEISNLFNVQGVMERGIMLFSFSEVRV